MGLVKLILLIRNSHVNLCLICSASSFLSMRVEVDLKNTDCDDCAKGNIFNMLMNFSSDISHVVSSKGANRDKASLMNDISDDDRIKSDLLI